MRRHPHIHKAKKHPHNFSIIFLLSLAYALPATATSENPAASGPEISESASAPPASNGIGNFWNKLTSSIETAVSGKRTTPQIADLIPGTYVKSNEAVGDEQDISEQRLRSFGLVQVPGMSSHANAILARLKAQSGVTDIPGQVLIVAKDGLEAASTADGNILVGLDYFNNLDSDDELAALLSHELAHVLLRHHDSNAFGKMQKQLQSMLVMGMQVHSAIEQASGKLTSNTLTAEQNNALLKMELFVELTDGALHPAWNRRQENEADRLAIDLLQRTGFSYSNGFKRLLEKVRKFEEQQNAKLLERQKESQRLTQELMATGKFDKGVEQGLGFAFTSIAEQLGRTHDGGDQRVDEAQSYIESIYPDIPKSPAQTATYTKLKLSGASGQMLKEYRQVFEAMQSVKNSDFKSAQIQLTPLLGRKSLIAKHAIPNFLMYEALKGLGREKEGLVFLNRSFEAPEPAWTPFDLAASYYKTRNPEMIPVLGRTAMTRFNGAPALYPLLIGMYTRSGQPERAKQLQSECQLNHVQYRDECNKNAQIK